MQRNLLAFILIATIAGCAHQAPRPPRTYAELQQRQPPAPQAPETALTAAQVDEELDLLLYALDRGYGGRAFVPEADWARLVARLQALRGQATTVERFCDELADALWQLPDAHLSARRFSVGNEPPVRCGPLARAARRAPSVGPNHAAEDPRPWAAEFLSSERARFGILSIKKFPLSGDPAWAEFDPTVEALRGSDGILIDLRGNGGGDDSRAYELAKALLDGPIRSGHVRTHKRRTPETVTLWMNTLDHFGRGPDGVLAPHLQAMYSEAEQLRAATLAGRGGRPEYEVEEAPPFTLTLGPHAFKGPIAILVDEGCASSCESGLEVLRLHPNARVFGQRTAGLIHFGNVGVLGLPHSGIRVGIPTKYNEYADGKLYDKIGLPPDELVPSGTDAFPHAMIWLEQQVARP